MRWWIAAKLTRLAHKIDFPAAFSAAEDCNFNEFGPEDPQRTEPNGAGGCIKAKLTYEGVIVDEYGEDGELLSTFGQTYDELLNESEWNAR